MVDLVSVPAGDVKTVAEELALLLGAPLRAGKTVVWLISGGSSVPIAVAAARLLSGAELSNLCVTLVDDVYGGEVAGTNWSKLRAQGFALEGAQSWGILTEGLSLGETGVRFAEFLAEKLAAAEVAIGQFGLGAGHHTGGIQTESEAAREDKELALGYQDGSIDRVTVTPALIARLDVAFVNSLGEDKRPLVAHFLNSTATIAQEPTQALKRATRTVLVSDVLPLEAE